MPRKDFQAPSDFDFGSDLDVNNYYRAMRSTVWSLKADRYATRRDGSQVLVTETASGVCIHRHGFIITAYHFLSGGGKIEGRFHGGGWKPMTVISQEFPCDIGILKVEGDSNTFDFDYADLAEKRDLRVGHRVLGIGPQKNLLFSGGVGYIAKRCPPTDYDPNGGAVYDGVVTAKEHAPYIWQKSWLYDNLIFIVVADIEWEAGASGAPLFNRFGEIIGINLISDPSFNFFVHVAYIKSLMSALRVPELAG